MSELNFINYDPGDLWALFTEAYFQEGGQPLYAGDEKAMLGRAALECVVRMLASVDGALKNRTRTYARGEYLKLVGDDRSVPYLEAQAAEAKALIAWSAGEARVLEKGAQMTADGRVIFETTQETELNPSGGEREMEIRCTVPGVLGNGVEAGTDMQLLSPIEGITKLVTITPTAGGQEGEDMEAYRERIALGPNQYAAGSAARYRALALSADSRVLDARALNGGAGTVNLYLIAQDGENESEIMAAAEQKAAREDQRPVNDQVNVMMAPAVEYSLKVQCLIDSTLQTAQAQKDFEAAAEVYRQWQDYEIGKTIDPYYLMSLLYQAGAARVTFEAESQVDGGPVQAMSLEKWQRARGRVEIQVVSA